MTVTIRQGVLNGICPYFTMFPLDFPYSILKRHAAPGEWIIDPFCGRGTTNYASRLLGFPSIGIDSSPVAAALTEAKLANCSPGSILRAAQRILDEVTEPNVVPNGPFWDWAYHKDVLNQLCRMREGLLSNCRSQSRKALRAVLLGALHGPLPKTKRSYFSNQSPRTYAPKPGYAVRYWKRVGLRPPFVDVLDVIAERATRYYAHQPRGVGTVIKGDSRANSVFEALIADFRVGWVITSPPYYGMRTYLPDQWLRMWFLGAKPVVDYSNECQLAHSSPVEFASQMRAVWLNVGRIARSGARMIVRFGAINDRKIDSKSLLKMSLEGSGWRLQTILSAGRATLGRRQLHQFSRPVRSAIEEHDFWAVWDG